MIVGSPGLGEEVGFELHAVGVAEGRIVVDRALDCPYREEWITGDLPRQLSRRGNHLAVWDHSIDEADTCGLVRVDQIAAQQQHQGFRASHQPHKPASSAPGGSDAQGDLLEAEMGGVAGDANIGGESHLASAAQAVSVYRTVYR